MRLRVRLLVLGAAAAAVLLVLGAAPAAPASTAATRVQVSMTEMKFVLSKSSAKAGTVIFVVKNVGKLPHDFKIAGKKTAVLNPGKSATLTVKLKKGSYPYLCTVAGHAAAGMKGVFKVT